MKATECFGFIPSDSKVMNYSFYKKRKLNKRIIRQRNHSNGDPFKKIQAFRNLNRPMTSLRDPSKIAMDLNKLVNAEKHIAMACEEYKSMKIQQKLKDEYGNDYYADSIRPNNEFKPIPCKTQYIISTKGFNYRRIATAGSHYNSSRRFNNRSATTFYKDSECKSNLVDESTSRNLSFRSSNNSWNVNSSLYSYKNNIHKPKSMMMKLINNSINSFKPNLFLKGNSVKIHSNKQLEAHFRNTFINNNIQYS